MISIRKVNKYREPNLPTANYLESLEMYYFNLRMWAVEDNEMFFDYNAYFAVPDQIDGIPSWAALAGDITIEGSYDNHYETPRPTDAQLPLRQLELRQRWQAMKEENIQ